MSSSIPNPDPTINDLWNAIDSNDIAKVSELARSHPALVSTRKVVGSCWMGPLYFAIEKKRSSIARILYQDFKAPCLGYDTRTDLYAAAISGDYSIFRMLIDGGENPFTHEELISDEISFKVGGRCGCGKTGSDHDHSNPPKTMTVKRQQKSPILMAAVRGNNLLIVRDLIDMGVDINNEDDFGNTALHYACFNNYSYIASDNNNNNNTQMISLLLSKGATINYQTSLKEPLVNNLTENHTFGCTPLHYSIMKNTSLETIQFLLEKGASINTAKTSFPMMSLSGTTRLIPSTTLLESVMDIGQYDSFNPKQIEKSLRVYTLCLSYRSEEEKMQIFKDKDSTPIWCKLHDYVYTNDFESVLSMDKEMLNEYLKISHPRFRTPMHIACMCGHILIAEFFIRKCSIDIDETMLEWCGDVSLFAFLIEEFEKQYEIQRKSMAVDDEDKDKDKDKTENHDDDGDGDGDGDGDDDDNNIEADDSECNSSISLSSIYGKLLVKCIKSENIEKLKILISHGADIHFDNEDALVEAWSTYNHRIFSLLIKHGADVRVCASKLLYLNRPPKEKFNDFLLNFRTSIRLGVDINTSSPYSDKSLCMSIIDGLKYSSQRALFEILFIILSHSEWRHKARFNLQQLMDLIDDKSLYEYPKFSFGSVEPRCPADDMSLEAYENRITYFPIFAELLTKLTHCSICMEWNADFINSKCSHRVICSNCARKIRKCPQCLAVI